ncbi:MAG TPA: TIGR03086 family metal-binding protein [Kineosporiaceae bacterium]|nr:TIGR03086 family metal-binding protein [Kineosporiaceae bacterium]
MTESVSAAPRPAPTPSPAPGPAGPAPEPVLDAELILGRYDRAFQVVDGVVQVVPEGSWALPTPCPDWSARDVLAHLLWGQDLIAAWLDDRPAPAPGGPGRTAEVPDGELATLWLDTRRGLRTRLDGDALARPVQSRLLGPTTIGRFLLMFPNDALLHAWDIATGTGVPVALPEDLAVVYLSWGEANESRLRGPGGFGPRIVVPEDAGVVDRWLGFAGRRPPTPAG